MKTLRLLPLLLLLATLAVGQKKDAPKKPADKKPATAEKAAAPDTTQPNPEDTRAMAESQAAAASGDKAALAPATPNAKFDMREVAPIVTHHSIKSAAGKTLQYTATTGRMPIKDAMGNVEAEMFYVAYTVDGQEPGR